MATCEFFQFSPLCPCQTTPDAILQAGYGSRRASSLKFLPQIPCTFLSKTRKVVKNYDERHSIPFLKEPALSDDSKWNEITATVQAIHRAAVIACVRSDRPEWALRAARSALSGGISVLEITLTTPCASEIIRSLVDEFPEATIGAGTVLSKTSAVEALDAGAKFLMSPATDEDLVSDFKSGPPVFIPGAMTPSEILRAVKVGAPMVKIFPIGYAGGVDLIRAMRRSMPAVPLVAAHKVSFDLIGTYVEAGASAVVLSDAIFQPKAMADQDMAKIQALAGKAADLGLLARAQTDCREYS